MPPPRTRRSDARVNDGQYIVSRSQFKGVRETGAKKPLPDKPAQAATRCRDRVLAPPLAAGHHGRWGAAARPGWSSATPLSRNRSSARSPAAALGFERFRHYQGVIDLRIDVTDISTQRFGFPAATASLRRTAPVDIDAARRRRIGEAMAADMLRQLDRALAAQIRERLAGFIR